MPSAAARHSRPPPCCESVLQCAGEGVLGGVESGGRVGDDRSHGSGRRGLVGDGL